MKTSILKLICASALLLSFSCSKQLDLSPEDYFAEGNFWKSEAQAKNFMVGLHKQLRDNQFQMVRLGEMRGGVFSNIDRQNTSLSELQIIEQRIDENSTGLSAWAGFYNPILQLNLFVSRVQGSGFMKEEVKNEYLGQAYGLRAFYYFHLLRTYGGVPLRLEPEVSEGQTDPVKLRRKRATEAEVLEVIKNDINRSISFLAGSLSSKDKSLWSANASYMLKGEIYLWSAKVYNSTADLEEAKTALEAVKGTKLLNNFSDVFAYSNKNNDEIIFALRYKVGEAEQSVAAFTYSTYNFDGLHYKDTLASSGIGNFLVDPLNIAQTNSQQIVQRYAYTYELFQSFDISDTRRDATFYDYYKLNTSVKPYKVLIRNTALVKFLGVISTNKRYFSDDWPVYREADRLLMLAEIVNAEGGDPSAYVQQIRDRAYMKKDPTPFINRGKDQNELEIFKERSKEFVYEGKRWYDMRRMKFAGEPLVFRSANHQFGVLDKAKQSHNILWPISKEIWTNDPLVDQTPGYSTSK